MAAANRLVLFVMNVKVSVNYHLNQAQISLFTAVTVLGRNKERAQGILADLILGAMVDQISEMIIDRILKIERCTQLFAIAVAINAKFLSSQPQASLFTVTIALARMVIVKEAEVTTETVAEIKLVNKLLLLT